MAKTVTVTATQDFYNGKKFVEKDTDVVLSPKLANTYAKLGFVSASKEVEKAIESVVTPEVRDRKAAAKK